MIHMVHDTYDAYDRYAEKYIICGEKRGTTKQHMIHMVRDDTYDRYAESILFVEKTRDNKATRSGTNRYMQKSILFA